MRLRQHLIGSTMLGLCLPAGALAQVETKLVANTRNVGDQFGIMCATSGNVAVVGARHDDEGGTNAGAAYVYDRLDTGWTQAAKLMASDAAPNDEFGGIIEFDGDRQDRLFVAALRDDHNGVVDSGSVYVFELVGGAWVEMAKLVPSDLTPTSYFGNNIDSDGDHLLVGSVGKNGWRGATYVFQEQNGSWVEVAKLTASDAAPDDRFGDAVTLMGNTAVIGAPGDDGAGIWSGSLYVFHLAGGAWVESSKVVPADLGPNDQFASAVDMTANYVIAGAREHAGLGAAYVYEVLDGQLVNETKLMAANGVASAQFGHDVAVDGQRALVGAVGRSSSQGMVHVFDLADNGFAETQQLVAADGQPGDRFGHSIGIHGRTMIVGAMGDDGSRGAAYVFEEPITVSASLSLVDAAPTELDLGQQCMVTVTPCDTNGQLVGPGLAVTISTTVGTLQGPVMDRGDGTYTQMLDGSAVGTAEVSAVADGIALENTAAVTVVDPMSSLGSVVGVLADGSMVPYQSIQSAVCAASADGLQRILVPPGDYDEVVVVRDVSGLSIEGLVSYGAVVVRGFRVMRSEDLVIANFEVREPRRRCHGVALRGGCNKSRGVMLVNVMVHGGSKRRGSGVKVGRGNEDVTIANGLIQGVAGDGIRMRGQGGNHTIHGCTVTGNGLNGIRLGRKVSVTVSDCEITDNGQRGRARSGYGILRHRAGRHHADPEMVTLQGNVLSGNHGKVRRGRSDENLGNYDQMLDPTDDQQP